MKVAVLGKGPSLNNYVEVPTVDEYVLVKKTESSEKHLNKMDTQDVYKIGEEIK